MMELIKWVYKTSTVKYKKHDKKTENLRIHIINTGSNNQTIPKPIFLAFRYNEAPVAP